MRFQAERAARLRSLHGKSPAHKPPGPGGLDPKQEVDQEFYREVERYLDKGVGACHLACPEIADAVATSLRFFEGQRYLLRSWVIMPNHVHVVVWPKPNFLLNAIVKTWKGYTAREANKILGRTGERFWQPESFDHWIRNDHQMAKVCQYVINNPVKARLCASPEQWRWSSAGPGPGTNLPGDPQ